MMKIMMNLMMMMMTMIRHGSDPCCVPSSSDAGTRAALRQWSTISCFRANLQSCIPLSHLRFDNDLSVGSGVAGLETSILQTEIYSWCRFTAATPSARWADLLAQTSSFNCSLAKLSTNGLWLLLIGLSAALLDRLRLALRDGLRPQLPFPRSRMDFGSSSLAPLRYGLRLANRTRRPAHAAGRPGPGPERNGTGSPTYMGSVGRKLTSASTRALSWVFHSRMRFCQSHLLNSVCLGSGVRGRTQCCDCAAKCTAL